MRARSLLSSLLLTASLPSLGFAASASLDQYEAAAKAQSNAAMQLAAATTPAAETSRLKSSLAQARADAGEALPPPEVKKPEETKAPAETQEAKKTPAKTDAVKTETAKTEAPKTPVATSEPIKLGAPIVNKVTQTAVYDATKVQPVPQKITPQLVWDEPVKTDKPMAIAPLNSPAQIAQAPVTTPATVPSIPPAPVTSVPMSAPAKSERVPLAHISEPVQTKKVDKNLIFDNDVATTSTQNILPTASLPQARTAVAPIAPVITAPIMPAVKPAPVMATPAVTAPAVAAAPVMKTSAPAPATASVPMPALPSPVVAEAEIKTRPVPRTMPPVAPPVQEIAPVTQEPDKGMIAPMPPAMPPAVKPTIAVSNEPVAKRAHAPIANDLNTVMPSMGHPAKQPVQRYLTPITPPVRANAPVAFRPAPAAAKGAWSMRTLEPTAQGKQDAFCLMENRFDNDTTLMIGQRADGASTVGINYNIDMLQQNKEYPVSVQVDGVFDESFTGYAQDPKTLIVQMGKKASFFSSLAGANAMRIAMQGSASSYAVKGIASPLNQFSDCVIKIGGMPLTAQNAPAAPDMPMVPVERVDAAPIAAPVTSARAGWAGDMLPIFNAAAISDPAFSANEKTATWHDTTGTISGKTENLGKKDIIDAASDALDQAEKSCQGEFSSQMGLPENAGTQTVQPMESKCVNANGQTTITTWLAQENNQTTTMWQMQSARDARGSVFTLRDKLLHILASNKS